MHILGAEKEDKPRQLQRSIAIRAKWSCSKSHGAAGAKSFFHSIHVAKTLAQSDLLDQIKKSFKKNTIIMKGSYAGCAHYLPDKILTNDDLFETVKTSNEWIVKRTGILKRHIVADHQTTSDMGINSCL